MKLPRRSPCCKSSAILTVFRICLASWNSFDVLCVGQQDLKVTFENVPHWLPINACGLHGDMLNAEPLQPRHQFVEFACCTSEAANLFLWFA